MKNKDYINMIDSACDYIRSRTDKIPQAAIILGSGLGPLADEIENPVVIDYADIPYFPVSTVAGHAGKLVYGSISGKYVLAMKGRFHYYEGNDMSTVTLPVRVFKKMGIENIIITNAAGGLGDSLNPGDIMIIKDHISLFCPSPLRGENLDEFGPRFPDMTNVYSQKLSELAADCGKRLGIPLKSGVYSFFPGPRYESPADIRALKVLGADATGMSTVPEAIVARHCEMNILGLSLITNKAAGLSGNALAHDEVVAIAKLAEKNMVSLVKDIVKDL